MKYERLPTYPDVHEALREKAKKESRTILVVGDRILRRGLRSFLPKGNSRVTTVSAGPAAGKGI